MNLIFQKSNSKENVNIFLNKFLFFIFIKLVFFIFRIKIILHRRRKKKDQKFIIK